MNPPTPLTLPHAAAVRDRIVRLDTEATLLRRLLRLLNQLESAKEVTPSDRRPTPAAAQYS